MTVIQDLIGKAEQAASSALLLVEAGDADGACNRACHAGRSQSEVQKIRAIAHYAASPIPSERANWAAEQAGFFLAAVRMLPILTAADR